MLNGVMTCTNINMAELAEELHRRATGYFYFPVTDGSRLKGEWDLTIAWSSANFFENPGSGEVAASGDEATVPAPSGAVSLYEALRKQLGLKAVREKRAEPLLVIDRINEQPNRELKAGANVRGRTVLLVRA
jgi:uncharacterized protein (TIGR03435 family)